MAEPLHDIVTREERMQPQSTMEETSGKEEEENAKLKRVLLESAEESERQHPPPWDYPSPSWGIHT